MADKLLLRAGDRLLLRAGDHLVLRSTGGTVPPSLMLTGVGMSILFMVVNGEMLWQTTQL